jgi:hypothetical protein
MDKNKIRHDPRHLGVPSGVSNMISEPTERSVETVHLSCTDANSICNRTKTRFHINHVTLKFHRVRPKQFLSQWYIWRKPCTYLASRILLCPNGPKWASTWASLIWSTIRCIQNDFYLWYVWPKPCNYLALTLRPSWNGPKWDSTWATSPRSSIGFVQNDFQAYGMFGANGAPNLHRH